MWKIIKMVLSLLLFGMAVHAGDEIRDTSDTVTVFMKEILDYDRAEQIINKEAERMEGGAVCFWQELPESSIYCKETGQNCQVTKLLVKGQVRLLIPEAEPLMWQPEGCCLDTETALELLGTKAAQGQCIWQGEESYMAKGSFEAEEHLMVCLADRGEGAFTALTLEFSGGGNQKVQAEQFLLRNGLTGDIVEFSFWISIIQNLLILFPAAVGIKLIGLLLSGDSGKEASKAGTAGERGMALEGGAMQKKGNVLAAAGVLAAVICMDLHYGSWPADWIPTRWSDFSFWQSCWESERQNLILILKSPMGGQNLELLLNTGKAALCGIAAILLL